MNEQSFYERFKLDDSIIQKIDFNPYYQKLQSGLDDGIQIDGKEFIDLASNNYLGIANDTRIKEAVIKAINSYGVSLCGTPIASGYSDLYEVVSMQLSHFVGLEASIIYPSCYQANNGLFSAIVTQEDVVIVDQYAHSSLIEGIRAVGCKIRPFLHNNMQNLEKNLQNSQKFRQIFVVSESVFSTEGSIAPLKDINDLCLRYKAIPIIDDSHGLGVIGKSGKGILEHAGIHNFEGIYTSSLGKAIGNIGGVISGKKSLIDYLKYYSTHLVYSTALPPHVLAGIGEALTIIENNFASISSSMWSHCNELKKALSDLNYTICDSKAPIISICTKSEESTLTFAKQLFQNNILSTPFIYPSVPKNNGIIRLIASANIRKSSIKRVINVLKQLR